METTDSDSERAKKLKMTETKDSKMDVFFQAVENEVMWTGVVSRLYKIEIDADIPSDYKYNIPTPTVIKPLYTFATKENLYPSGMSFVHHNSKLYFMGGSIDYVVHLLDLTIYDKEFVPDYDLCDNAPISNAFATRAACYPSDVFVFDCSTCNVQPWISMTSGKAEDPLTFVIENKIFVLSTKKAHEGMIVFETINPIFWKQWKKLKTPPEHFFDEDKDAFGSALIQYKFLITFRLGAEFHLLCYDTKDDIWTDKLCCYLPAICRDSVFVHDTLYSVVDRKLHADLRNETPVLSFHLVDDTYSAFVLLEGLNKYSAECPHTPICLDDIQDWPKYDNEIGFVTRQLLHLERFKGSDKDSRFLGLVELFMPYQHEKDIESSTQCQFRFVAFEASKGSSVDVPFNAKTIHACHFLPGLSPTSAINSACVLP